jgi:hypothetical protein
LAGLEFVSLAITASAEGFKRLSFCFKLGKALAESLPIRLASLSIADDKVDCATESLVTDMA